MEAGVTLESGNGRAPVECVVWRAASAPIPSELLKALERRSIRPRVVTRGLAALAEVCVLRRASEDDRPGLLMLVSPESLPEVWRVIGAVERYGGETRVWMFEPGANPPLRKVVEQDVERWKPAPAHERGPGPEPKLAVGDSAGPALRLGPSSDEAGPVGVGGDEEMEGREDALELPGGPGSVLTDEELSMLLEGAPLAGRRGEA